RQGYAEITNDGASSSINKALTTSVGPVVMLNEYLIIWVIGICLMADSLMRFLLLCVRILLLVVKRNSLVARTDGSLPAASNGAAILIASHNEAGTIGRTVQALDKQLNEWPSTKLWVVADRCNDATAEEATNAGANVAVRVDGKLGKCAVISWWLENYRSEWQ